MTFLGFVPFVISSSVRRKLQHRVKYLRNLRRTRYPPAWWPELVMGRVSAKAQRVRDHNAKMWQTRGQQGEKGGNQDHCCDHAAHQKSQHPIARDGKVGVSRLPEEDHHRCAKGDLVSEKV